MKLRDFDGRAPLSNRSSVSVRLGEIMVTSCCHRVAKRSPASEESPLTNLSIKRLTRLQFGRTYRFAVEDLACDGDLSFDIIYTSWACRVCAISGRERTATRMKLAIASTLVAACFLTSK